jgi:hypothetical protein
LKAWCVNAPLTRQWVIRHALRRPCREGDHRALRLVGLSPNPTVNLKRLRLDGAEIPLGGVLRVTYSLSTTAADSQAIVVHHRLRLRSRPSARPSSFKITDVLLMRGADKRIEWILALQPRITRRVVPGTYRLEVVINGSMVASRCFKIA